MSLPAAVGSLRLADGVGAALDRNLVDGAYYLRVSNTFRADLGLTFSSSELGVGYGLRLIPDPNTLSIDPFHSAEIRYKYATSRFVFSLVEVAGIGRQSFLGAGRVGALGGLPPVQDARVPATVTPTLAVPSAIDSTLLPAAQSLLAVTTRTAASAQYNWDHQLSSAFILGYQLSGGLNSESQRYLALQQVVDGSALLNYAVSARMNWVSALVVARGWNSRDDKYALFTLSESWLYRWSPLTSVDLGAGISSRLTDELNGTSVLVTTPVAAAGITHTLRGRDATGLLRLGVTYAPLVDPVTARIQNRLSVLGTASITHADLVVGLSAGLSQTVPDDDPGAVSSLNANVFSAYQFTSWLGASLSAQITRQAFVTDGLPNMRLVPSGVTWGVYGGLYAVSPTWRF